MKRVKPKRWRGIARPITVDYDWHLSLKGKNLPAWVRGGWKHKDFYTYPEVLVTITPLTARRKGGKKP